MRTGLYFLLAALLLTFSNGYAEETASLAGQPDKAAAAPSPAGQPEKPVVAPPLPEQLDKPVVAPPLPEQLGKPVMAPPLPVKQDIPVAAPPVEQLEKPVVAPPLPEQLDKPVVAPPLPVKQDKPVSAPPVTRQPDSAVAAPAPSAQPVKTEEVNPFADDVGKWSFSMNDPGPDLKKVSSASRNKIKKELQEIAKIVTSTPAMNPPKGFEARFWGSISGKDRFDICTGKGCPPLRPNAALAMMIGRYEEKNGKRRAAFNTPSTMDISVNNLGHVFAHLPVIYRDKDGFLFPEPKRDGERLGMPVYLNNGHAIAVLTNSNKPFWLPVSRERYLKAAMEETSRDLGLPPSIPEKGKNKAAEIKIQSGKPIMVEEARSWIDPLNEQELVESSRSLTDEVKDSANLLLERLKQLQSELDALTPEQLTMQARVNIKVSEDGTEVTLLPPDSSGGVAVVTPDFGFFNNKPAPEAVQLIVVQWKFDGNPVFDPEKPGITETLHNQALLNIYKSMDWQKLKGKVR